MKHVAMFTLGLVLASCSVPRFEWDPRLNHNKGGCRDTVTGEVVKNAECGDLAVSTSTVATP